MAIIDAETGTAVPGGNLVRITHIMYALHAFSAVTGMLTPALIVTAFLTGWPSIIAVIINYVNRGRVTGTYLDSHFSWQLRTFWFAVMWVIIGWLLIVTIIGIVVGVPLLLLVGLWVLYRIVRGWIALANREPVPSRRP